MKITDFLRLSRSTIDDSITSNLNALLTPGNQGFDPSSTSTRSPSSRQKYIPGPSCQNFKNRVLFSSWQARGDLLDYCDSVARNEGLEGKDAEEVLREEENEKGRRRLAEADERRDPYSGRFFPMESRREVLAGIVRQERGVERIVRARTWKVVNERCGEEAVARDWEAALEEWRRQKRS